ncbi:YjcZ family sporulation protein [Domibacillus sp. 8LH]|nr:MULTISPECIES: YjcZ family sporulation protein [Domibacillus]WNS82425.1 YjcZ family sporulation protein [Domibacillus sp. DTU_2020_1001157_1_SI_ALB_TIR_016]
MGYKNGDGYGSGFALIVVLFILLIIIGASYVGGGF